MHAIAVESYNEFQTNPKISARSLVQVFTSFGLFSHFGHLYTHLASGLHMFPVN